MSSELRPGAPKISVLVPTYNYARFLPEALDSILAQKDADFEIIISDDASSDESAPIIRDYARRDPRIRIFLNPENLGMVANWNFCLRHARGEYVKYLFGDDLLVSPHALSALAALLDADQTVTLASSARQLLDAGSRPTGCWNDLPEGTHAGPELLYRCLRTRRNLIGEPTAVMFRRSDGQRGFDPAFRQIVDLEMWFLLLLKGNLAHVSTPLCGFRRHAAQQTEVNRRTRVTDRETLEIISRYLDAPELKTHISPGSFAHRKILFRQMHYMRKAGARGPEAAMVLAKIHQQLPWPWLAGCWIWHRTARPCENLARKFHQWKASFSKASRPAQAAMTRPAFTKQRAR